MRRGSRPTRRHFVVGHLVGLALAVAACGGSTADIVVGVDEYAADVAKVEAAFEEAAGDPSAPVAAFAVGGDLVGASEMYMAYDRRVDGWADLTAPPQLSQPHTDLVAALQELQDEVGHYLNKAGLDGKDFDFRSIGTHPEIARALASANAACADLRREAGRLGVALELTGGCDF